MKTTKFNIEPYLAEYLKAKYGTLSAVDSKTTVVELPENIYLYHVLSSLTIKQPANIVLPNGNIEVVLPYRRIGERKCPDYYNYVSSEGAFIFNRKATLFFRAELHEFIDQKKHEEGMTYKEACFMFIYKYSIESIDAESLLKNYARWKEKVRAVRKKAYATR